MKITTLAVAAAGLVAACTAQPQRKITVTTPPPSVKTVAAPPAPQPQPTVVVPAPPQVTTVVQQDENARREAAAARARAQEAERQRQEEAQRAAEAEARAEEAEQQTQEEAARSAEAEERARAEAQAREDAERRASDIEREIASITEVQRTERGLVVTLSGDVLFEFDRAAILPPAETKLARLATALSHTDRGVTIEGHTDAVGDDAYNQQLSYRRAVAVRDTLVAHGVPAARLKVMGYGESHPVADNGSPEGRAMNRRVELIIDDPAAAPASSPR